MLTRQIIIRAALLSLIPLTGACNRFCSPITFGDCEEEVVAPPTYTFDLYWSVKGSQEGSVCEAYGISYWIIEMNGNGTQQQRLDCIAANDHWSWRFLIGREPLYPGRYTVTVTAFDALDRPLASQAAEVDLNADSAELHLTFSDSDLGFGGCQLTSAGGSPAGALPLLLLLVLAVSRRLMSKRPQRRKRRQGLGAPHQTPPEVNNVSCVVGSRPPQTKRQLLFTA